MSCNRCSRSHSNVQAFLLICHDCNRKWHHRCHIPPVADKELIERIKAHNNGDLINGLQGWRCKRCVRGGTSAIPTTAPRDSMAPPLTRDSSSRSLSVQSSSYDTDTRTLSRYPSSIPTGPHSLTPSVSVAESHDSHSTSRSLQSVALVPMKEDDMIIDDDALKSGLLEPSRIHNSLPLVSSTSHLKRTQSYPAPVHQPNIRTRTPDDRDATEESYRPRKKHASGHIPIISSTPMDHSPGTQALIHAKSNQEKEIQRIHERTEQSPSHTLSRKHKGVEPAVSGAGAGAETSLPLVSETFPPPPNIATVQHSQVLAPLVVTTTSPARLRNRNIPDTRLMTYWIHEHAKNNRDPWEIASHKKSHPAPPSSTRRKSIAQKLSVPQSKLYYFNVSECVNGFKRG